MMTAIEPHTLAQQNRTLAYELGLSDGSRHMKGTKLTIDALKNHSAIEPGRVIIDHIEEHTAPLVRDAGFWAGMTLYPESKVTPNRAVDMLEMFGSERIWMNSACDWGISDPLAVPKAALEMRRRGYDDEFIDKVVYQNPAEFMGHEVPEVLLSGDHARVDRWRREQSLLRTLERRPDLLETAELTEDDRKFLEKAKKRQIQEE